MAHLEALEDDLIGVTKVNVDFKRQQMTVEFEEEAQSSEGIARAVADMGYVAVMVENGNNVDKEALWKRLFR
jgi:copper chaperone CopZ